MTVFFKYNIVYNMYCPRYRNESMNVQNLKVFNKYLCYLFTRYLYYPISNVSIVKL